MKSSSPAKIILLGEHAAVYGNPVIAATVNLRTYIDVRKRNDSKFSVTDINKNTEIFNSIDCPKFTEKFPVVAEGIRKVENYINQRYGLNIEISSQIPIGKGLGSSASLASALCMATAGELEHTLTINEIANLSWDIENIIHKKSSGVDPFTVSYGGIIKYTKGNGQKIDADENLDVAIADTGITMDTGNVVMDVFKLKERNEEIFDEWLNTMKILVNDGINFLKNMDYEGFADLMNINHGMLYAVGVSSVELEKTVFELRKFYKGAKLCGKGRGGIAIGLKKITEQNPINLNFIDAKICNEGVRIEK
ncbi:MAG: mevalonate kinase [Candidatus Altiarchaeum hamiconexum]|uniref:mevalonate kinase n=1 Tax=Candidatus Altarchaeum hamiconexum TaxID=1803513 RepID=A0A8J7YY34_9ARCH|nr:mevalonate kinase [Candidatus Altarchaeum hamiconexum]OIQ06039.1 MAG: mevalonate kinase [Candidatus Altarchaeum sp. CG2_30_32_3053]PIN67383.1 MAG: mevalonate kinase [Candidatus Altarchaeum sp. CG12_big_fil_rev_8_21_14_0_65_33_22]PIV28157.1 MAG: mevalonate kinase [Candidatus Altarchaeum sp. CG03_land_8_20_14_0_80_32_618]PIX48843.1 MAG: mevalonate kinase [Candidatus Altarchaeum sp. CG_4_8_14_3_um_filter_33_2054]PIZ29278.1 MAG: mevalonate kinase [Candidatus Altarchaeum sp. CG_4_10_14_0_8_um_fi